MDSLGLCVCACLHTHHCSAALLAQGGGGEAERHLRGCTFPPPLRQKGTTY